MTVVARLAALLTLAAPTTGAAAAAATAAAPTQPNLERRFSEVVRPFLVSYCLECHGQEKPKGQLNLAAFSDVPSVTRELAIWGGVEAMLASREMPPAKAARKPAEPERALVLEWIRALRQRTARKQSGDPGVVLARRLSNAEYDYTIRDLTGVDLRPAREFPIDPANEAGFDNSGESLVMSPALLRKHLDAARTVADHLVLGPQSLSFAPHPVVTDTDRDRYAVERIVSFYRSQPTDLSRYFLAAWRFRHRAALGSPAATLAEIAARDRVSPTYLREVWNGLTVNLEDIGPLAKVQGMFRALPAPPAEAEARAATSKMRDFVGGLRPKLSPAVENMELGPVSSGSQPFVLWKNSQRASQRATCDGDALHVPAAVASDRLRSDSVEAAAALAMAVTHFSFRNIVHDSALPIPFGVHELSATFSPPDPELAIPDEASRPRYAAAFSRFCALFPDAFYVAERGRTNLEQPRGRQAREEKGRLLSAGYHNMFGFFRDDLPLYRRVLDERGRRQLDELWHELDFITDAPRRQHADFIFYERAESKTIKGPAFDFVRSEDRSATSESSLRKLTTAYLGLARESLKKPGGDARAVGVLEKFFVDVSTNLRRVERERRSAESAHLAALVSLARRAYRRPLTAAQRSALTGFYRSLRADGLDHDTALRDALVRILMSPHFLYRADLVPGSVAGSGARPLDGHALASRLSYFLWSSLPDQELSAHADRGDLSRAPILNAQVRRMLRDPRARALALEFGGQWLDFRRFEEHNAVDRERFPEFDDRLRRAMLEEPVRFLQDVASADRSVLELLDARHTFVNGALARHYKLPAEYRAAEDDRWLRVDDADRYQRGGLLPMAVFLTRNAPGLRTSPVKRGYWVVRRLLGEHIPPPPAAVPELPTDERKLGNLTLRQTLAQHRDNEACSGCHARFDGFGLAFEGYGPVGESRTVDLGGRPVDTQFSVGTGDQARHGTGLAGLREHLRGERADDFLDNLCRKLLGYALSRGLLPSDESTVLEMRERLGAEGHRFGALVETIVSSPQFLHRRGPEVAWRR